MRRSSYFQDSVLGEIAGRCRFGAAPIEQKIEQIPEPRPNPWVFPPHPHDELASHFGLKGFEFKALQDAAMREMPHNNLLREYYKRFLMVARLVPECEDALEKTRDYESRQAQDKANRENRYDQKKRDYDARVKSLTRSWEETRATIRTRWARLERSLAKLLEADASLQTLADRDYHFVMILNQRGILEVAEERVVSVNWDKFQDTYIEDINAIILELNDSPGGGFIKDKEASD